LKNLYLYFLQINIIKNLYKLNTLCILINYIRYNN